MSGLEEAALHRLREFEVKFPFVPICGSPQDVYRVLDDPQLNTVGLELITTTTEHPWLDASVVREFQDRGVFVFVNTVTLTTGIHLFGGLDDELAISDSPARAYGPLLSLGVNAIQTDWPAIVRSYRDDWLAAEVAPRRAEAPTAGG